MKSRHLFLILLLSKIGKTPRESRTYQILITVNCCRNKFICFNLTVLSVNYYCSFLPIHLFLFLPAVVQQFYQSRVIDEFVLLGNTAILKCLVPSFVTDFVQIEAWITDDGKSYTYDPNSSDTYGNHSNCVEEYYYQLSCFVFLLSFIKFSGIQISVGHNLTRIFW